MSLENIDFLFANGNVKKPQIEDLEAKTGNEKIDAVVAEIFETTESHRD